MRRKRKCMVRIEISMDRGDDVLFIESPVARSAAVQRCPVASFTIAHTISTTSSSGREASMTI